MPFSLGYVSTVYLFVGYFFVRFIRDGTNHQQQQKNLWLVLKQKMQDSNTLIGCDSSSMSLFDCLYNLNFLGEVLGDILTCKVRFGRMILLENLTVAF